MSNNIDIFTVVDTYTTINSSPRAMMTTNRAQDGGQATANLSIRGAKVDDMVAFRPMSLQPGHDVVILGFALQSGTSIFANDVPSQQTDGWKAQIVKQGTATYSFQFCIVNTAGIPFPSNAPDSGNGYTATITLSTLS